MKILFLITKGDLGGAQKNVFLLANGFKKDSHDICVGIGDRGFLAENLEDDGIKTKIFNFLKRTQNPFWGIFFIFELRKFLKENNFDLLSFNSSNTLWGMISIWGLKNKPKTVFTVHGSGFLSPGFKKSKISKLFFLLYMKFFMPLADKIIFVSNYDKMLAKKYGLFKDGQDVVIYNGIENINFLTKEESIKKLKEIKNFSDNKLIIGTISRLEYAKGNDILIEAIGKLPKNILDKCAFLIIGGGPEISKLKIQDNVFLLGDVPEANKYLNAFDVFIMTSRYEGMPYALLEAMSAELPIIISDVGGVKEAIGDAGVLIKQGDVEGVVDALMGLIDGPEKRKIFSQKAKERIKNFSVNKNLEEVKKLFISLVG